VTVTVFGLGLHDAPRVESAHQSDILYLIYGLGFAGVWGLYALLYAHALRKRKELQLNDAEVLQTRADLYANLIYVAVCFGSIALAFSLDDVSVPGYFYMILAPLHTVNGIWFGRKLRKLVRARAHAKGE
jgi:hypothetical protein